MAIYGIDLGTTNSLLGVGDHLLTGLVPSIVNLDNKTAGEINRHDSKSVRSFKVDMSTGTEGLMPVKASSEVLKELKREAGLYGKIKAVITVPADFDDNQRKATRQAAESADIEVVTLINEPTAAALYITKNSKEVAVVFDLGGGTFDVSVIDSRFGSYDVQHSAGDPKCGGDNLDTLIMSHLCKSGKIQLFRLNKDQQLELKLLATSTKIKMQRERHDFDVDLRTYGGQVVTFTEATYIQLMKAAFMKCMVLLHRVVNSSLQVGEKFNVVLVGGSTRCPYLREWVAQEIGQEPVPLTYDPDRAVALGAALYAQMYEDGTAECMVSDVTKGLSIGLSDGTVLMVVQPNSNIPIEEETIVSNPVETERLIVKLYQGDSGLISGNSEIGTLIYDYGKVMAPRVGVVIVTVSVESSGMVKLTCKELGKAPVSKELILT